MAFALTTASRVTCTEQGTVSLTASYKLKVAGNSVVTLSEIRGKSVAGCANTNKPCTTVSSASGESAKLKVGGKKVALDTLSGQTDGQTPSLAPATASQSKLKA